MSFLTKYSDNISYCLYCITQKQKKKRAGKQRNSFLVAFSWIEFHTYHLHNQMVYGRKSIECGIIMKFLQLINGVVTHVGDVDSFDWKDYGVDSIISTVC